MRPVEALFFPKKTRTALRQAQGERCRCGQVNNGQSLEEAIRTKARELGFVACGFARAEAANEAGIDLKRWLEAGHHGTMGWMEARAHHRVSPMALWPEAKSAIALGMSYAPATDPMALAGRGEVGRISVYAQGGDYHKTVKKG